MLLFAQLTSLHLEDILVFWGGFFSSKHVNLLSIIFSLLSLSVWLLLMYNLLSSNPLGPHLNRKVRFRQETRHTAEWIGYYAATLYH